MKIKFSHLTEAIVQTPNPLVFGGVGSKSQQTDSSLLFGGLKQQTPTEQIANQTQQAKPQTEVQAVSKKLEMQPRADVGIAPAPEVKSEPQSETQPSSQLQTQSQPQPQLQTQSQPRPQSQPQPQTQSQPQPQIQATQQIKSQTPSERYRESQERYLESRRKHGESLNASNKGAWTIGESMRFRPNALKNLLNDAFDPNNPFPMPWSPGGPMNPKKPSSTPVPKGPYSPTPGGVAPSKTPKVIFPKPSKSGGGMGGAGEEKDKEETPNYAWAALIPPQRIMSGLSGRIGGHGFDAQAEEDYGRHYRNLLAAGKGTLSAIPVVGKLLGRGAGLASMLPTGVSNLVQSYIDAAEDEGEMLFKKALLDPRARRRRTTIRKDVAPAAPAAAPTPTPTPPTP